MLRKLSFLLLLLTIAGSGYSQKKENPPGSEDAIEAEYEKRIKKEYLAGVYIPKDLADCFIQMNNLIDEKSKQKFKTAPEELVAKKLHFSLGRWIMVNWSLYRGSRLSAYLKNVGVHYPDDMARFIIISYHRNLNRNELKIKDQVEFYKEYRKKKFDEERVEGEVIFEQKKKLTQPPEGFNKE